MRDKWGRPIPKRGLYCYNCGKSMTEAESERVQNDLKSFLSSYPEEAEWIVIDYLGPSMQPPPNNIDRKGRTAYCQNCIEGATELVEERYG